MRVLLVFEVGRKGFNFLKSVSLMKNATYYLAGFSFRKKCLLEFP